MDEIVRVARICRIPKLLRLLRLYGFVISVKETIELALWRPRAMKLYSQFIRPGDIAFDVGAWQGTRTDIFHRLGATVVAVEPQPYCINNLRRRYGNNDRVFLEQIALGSRLGQAELMIKDCASNVSTLSKEFIEAVKSGIAGAAEWHWSRKITVDVDTLDNLIRKYGRPSFCKIDVEGYEYEVLMGLSQPIKALSFEFHPALYDTFVKIIDRLNMLGFTEYNYSMGESMVLALPKWVTSQEIIDIVAAMPRQMVHGDIYARV